MARPTWDRVTCSVVIASTRDATIRLCKHPASRFIEVNGETLFAVCALHRGRVMDLLGQATGSVDKANTRST